MNNRNEVSPAKAWACAGVMLRARITVSAIIESQPSTRAFPIGFSIIEETAGALSRNGSFVNRAAPPRDDAYNGQHMRREIVSGHPVEEGRETAEFGGSLFIVDTKGEMQYELLATSERVIEQTSDHKLIEITQTVQSVRYEVSGDAGGSWGGATYPIGSPEQNVYVVKEASHKG